MSSRVYNTMMSFYPEMYLFTDSSAYNTCIMDLPLSSFVFQFFLQSVGVDSMIAVAFPWV